MRSAFANKVVPDFRPVTDALLRQPPDADWLTWRRTLDGQGYSPLDQITRENVAELRTAWVLAMREGSNQPPPLVHDGVMYLVNPGNIVQALDAGTGEMIWEHRHTFPPNALTLGGPTRSIAMYQDKIFLSTYDAAIVALDARTGETVVADGQGTATRRGSPTRAGRSSRAACS